MRKEQHITTINTAYRFGCLLAILENEQAIMGNPQNAYQRLTEHPIEFVPMIDRLNRLGKGNTIAEIMAGMPVDAFHSGPLIDEELKIFGIGYYQQKALLKQY
jgi:hypothetical protein